MGPTSTPSASWAVRLRISAVRFAWSRLHGPILGLVRTGILGGTFDPIHIAHLHAGEVARHQAGLDRVVFIPAGDPWQKTGQVITPAAHRLAMTRIAADGIDGFEVDDREVSRDGLTYTIDTLETFDPGEELFLILGADAALGLPTWKQPRRVLDRATVLVAPRPGTDSTAVAAVVGKAMFLDMAVLEVSGTEIREMARGGQPFRFLVTPGVYEYIIENNLYAEDEGGDMVEDSPELEESS